MNVVRRWRRLVAGSSVTSPHRMCLAHGGGTGGLMTFIPHRHQRLIGALLICGLFLAGSVRAAELGQEKPVAPKTPAESWSEAELAIKQFQTSPGFKVQLFAAEPQLQNPVAFCLDERGRIYVSETHRYRSSALDIRHYMSWYPDDLACRTVEDRLAEIQRHLGPDAEKLGRESEIVRFLEDRNGDGKADVSKIFAGGFNSLLDGIASGVLARKGNVYFANIPNLWLLRDRAGQGTADVRESLSYGYGVRFSLTGHDLHGLKIGPDGKLYFTVGDRGAHVQTKEGKILDVPECGAAFRCNLDGTELEIFATGLRNPQELAFNEFGDLFTGDNNCDHGDAARFVYVVEGGDSGWRVGYQFSEQNPAGLWNAEKLWRLPFPGQAAYLVPPVGHIASGPSGLAYFPGVGFSPEYEGHFFLCDFRGSSAISGIHTFMLEPKGAGFQLVRPRHFLWNILATDAEFGPDGRLYVSDWVQGWPKSEQGRIYRIFQPDLVQTPVVLQTRQFIGEGMGNRSLRDLTRLLAHPDMRVRQEAQFALADRGKRAIKTLAAVAERDPSRVARLHAIWGLGQIAAEALRQHTSHKAAINPILPLLEDKDPEVRAQAAKALGEAPALKALPGLIKLLNDPSARVRFFAALSVGKLHKPEAIGPIVAMLRENQDQDPFVRHAGVSALVAINDFPAILALAKDPAPSVRMASLLAMRRLERPEVSQFLNDKEALLVVEAARAINDLPVVSALPELAALADQNSRLAEFGKGFSELDLRTALLRRVLNANLRLGTPESAKALAQVATRSELPDALRAEALQFLADWPKPSPRDKVTGLWRPLPARPPAAAEEAARAVLPRLLETAPEPVRAAAAETSQALRIKEAGPALFQIFFNARLSGNVRRSALRALAQLKDPRLSDAVKSAQADPDELVRAEANRLQVEIAPGESGARLASVLEHGSIKEKQAAFGILAILPGSVADEIILGSLQKLVDGQIEKEAQLDLLEAAQVRSDLRIKKELEEEVQEFLRAQPFGDFQPALQGGNAELGKKVFFERPQAACVRCHKIRGEGGDVGPDLSQIGSRKDRNYILESIVSPNKQIAPGFETVVVKLANGMAYAGIVKTETDAQLELNSPEDGLVKVNKAEIQTRQKGISAMPEELSKLLTKRDIRDVVEYLAGLKN